MNNAPLNKLCVVFRYTTVYYVSQIRSSFGHIFGYNYKIEVTQTYMRANYHMKIRIRSFLQERHVYENE